MDGDYAFPRHVTTLEFPAHPQYAIKCGYTAADIPSLRLVERQCFQRGVAYSLQDFREVLACKDTRIWIAKDKRDVHAGFLISWLERGLPHVASVDVALVHRGHGLAGQLMDRCEAYYCGQRHDKITLQVATDNPAQMLYFKRGYRITRYLKNQPDAGGKDALWMEKIL